MRESKTNSAQAWAEALLDELAAGGVTTVCLSPGSRSAPLVAAAARHPLLQLVTHVDERGAAFFCLGIGRATGQPAVWITTSGTAVANGLPAVVEARMDGVPMILLTADRPPELIDTGANQAINQKGLFVSHVHYQVDLPVPSASLSTRLVRDTVALALAHATATPAGPAHINCPFRKPLEPDWTGPVGPSKGPVTSYSASRRIPDASNLGRALSGRSRGIILAGRMSPDTALRCEEMAKTLGWPVICDVMSQQRLGRNAPYLIKHGDLIVGLDLPSPEAVIQVGRTPVSQRVIRFLSDAAPAVWAVIADGTTRIDPHHKVTHRLADAGPGCDAVAGLEVDPVDAGFKQAWIQAEARVSAALPTEVLAAGLTEPAVALMVSEEIPNRHGLVLGSSMPVRDMDTFGSSAARPAIVVANRGASGIDGTLSTAAGVARGLSTPVTLVVGDQTFLHDLNGLALVQKHDVIVVLVNNDGGGIFSFLPIAEHEELFEPFFGTAHGKDFRAAADLFGISYTQPANTAEFRAAYRNAVAAAGPCIIEVQTERGANRKEHERLRDAVQSWLC